MLLLLLSITWRHVGGVEVCIHFFLISALDVDVQLHTPTALPQGKSLR